MAGLDHLNEQSYLTPFETMCKQIEIKHIYIIIKNQKKEIMPFCHLIKLVTILLICNRNFVCRKKVTSQHFQEESILGNENPLDTLGTVPSASSV